MPPLKRPCPVLSYFAQIRAAFLDAPEAADKAEVGIFYNDKIALLNFDDFLSRIFPADTPENTNKKAVKAA